MRKLGVHPSKTLIHSALFHQEARLGARVGLGIVEGGIDYDSLTANKDQVVQHLRQTKYLDVLREGTGVDGGQRHGPLHGRNTLEVGGRVIQGEKFLIATGGFPRIIEFPGLHGVDYLTSRSALLLKEFPRSLVIIGGGVIALELGQMFHRLGSRVTVLEHGSRVLPFVEEGPAMEVQETLAGEGMEIVLNVLICSVRKTAEGTVVTAEVEGSTREYPAERLLLAVGTAPASYGIGLEQTGVKVDGRGFILVDDRMRTSAPGIWAAGDVTGGMMIATVGAREGIVAVEDMLNPACGCRVDYLSAPMTIFTDPELGMVGLPKSRRGRQALQLSPTRCRSRPVPKAHVTGATPG